MSIRNERKQQSRQALLDAALKLSTTGRAFSTISLRELAREVGLVPTAFYRHFEDMEQLGQALVEQVSGRLKLMLSQLRQGYLKHQDAKTKTSIQLFFRAVDQSPQDWFFLIGERWGGSETVRREIAKEIESLTRDLANDLEASRNFQHVENHQDLYVMTTIIVNLSLTWAMTWLNLPQQYQGELLKQQQQIYLEHAMTQVRLLFRGIANWQSIE
ncbi:TetR family transcriptional regulator [Acinetobacter qingfengensis]|uniref:TetR family transcriptional regulator n=1 Tax=Acinetobacter qingfengensis TaxID=1262585 RepID=A0A1E7R586_9GAMM|nr:TetR family transcriptional regulator [Acinetobacter qingfengensis]KAA8730923.1 TetR family transcriptional regulator [Acinetobacter qingfengensis]OEY94478.1 TetR family transcriptional regulator [Acinetobacter qingfengensis]